MSQHLRETETRLTGTRFGRGLGINYLREKHISIRYERERTFSFRRLVHKHDLRVYIVRVRLCVYETYFPVEPLSMTELQRRRANRRALPNANTVFTCDCSWMHLAARDDSRGYNRVSISSHLAVSLTDDPYSCGSFAGFRA